MSLLRTPMRLAAAVAVAGALAGGALAVSSTPAFADGSLSNVGLSVDNNAASQGGVTNAATYTWTFTTATTGSLTELTFTVPDSTGGTPALASISVGGCSGMPTGPTGSPDTISLPLTTCDSVPAGTNVSVQISGIQNAPQAGTFTFSSSVVATTTTSGSPATDSGTSNTVDFSNNSNITSVNIEVPDSLTFSNDNTAISLTPTPGVPTIARPVDLKVSTNATNGYKLSGCVQSDFSDGNGHSIGELSALGTLPGASGPSAFGAQAAISQNGGAAGLVGDWGSTGSDVTGDFLGYQSTCGTATTPSTGPQVISSDNEPTSGDTLTLTNGVGISSTQNTGTYSGTIAYLVTPSY